MQRREASAGKSVRDVSGVLFGETVFENLQTKHRSARLSKRRAKIIKGKFGRVQIAILSRKNNFLKINDLVVCSPNPKVNIKMLECIGENAGRSGTNALDFEATTAICQIIYEIISKALPFPTWSFVNLPIWNTATRKRPYYTCFWQQP